MKLQRANSPGKSFERGQTFLVIAIFIAVFVLVMLGVAADYTQVWAHRQMAQGAADAACQAGAADLFLQAEDPSVSGTNGVGSFGWIGGATTSASGGGGLVEMTGSVTRDISFYKQDSQPNQWTQIGNTDHVPWVDAWFDFNNGAWDNQTAHPNTKFLDN